MRFVGFNAMKRRSVLRLFVLAAAAPAAARAQPATRRGPVRIAILDDATEPTRRALWDAMVRRLAELGYVEGRNAVVEMRFADGNADRLRALAAASVASNPDVVVTVTTGGGLAMRAATTSIPVVVLGPADPVKSGLVASLARPGGNVTGLSPNQAEIAVKWLELLRLLAPRARAFAYLTDPANPGEMLVFRELERRALALDLRAQAMDGVDAGRVERAFAAMQSRPPDALVVATSASLLPQRRQIVEGAARLRVPAIYARQEYPEAGGLLSYGADSRTLWLRAAEYVDRILRGVSPADLPFEMAATYRLVLNAATARALGLAVPESLKVRADEVIE